MANNFLDIQRFTYQFNDDSYEDDAYVDDSDDAYEDDTYEDDAYEDDDVNYINNEDSNTTINGKTDRDVIINNGSSVIINGDAGNDSIKNKGAGVTIIGGKGNDSIKNTGENVLFQYTDGDDNDVIEGFNSTSTLSISGGSYSTQRSGNDVIVTVGGGRITLQGAASLSKVNIVELSIWRHSGTTATYGTSKENLITVSGVKSLEGISLSGTVVTVAASALNKSNVTISDGYTLAIANDVEAPKTTAAAWSINGTTATYKNTSVSAGYTLNNNQIIYTPNSGGEICTISGVKNYTGLSISGKTVTVAASALNNSNVTISEGYTLTIANDVAAPKTTAAAWSFNGSTAIYKASSTSAGYTLNNNQIVYTPSSGGETCTVSGVKSTSGITISGKTVTVAASALNNGNVTISDGYTLAIASDVEAPKTTEAAWSINGTTATYKNTSVSAGYTLNNNQIIYTPNSGGETCTVSGLKSLDGLSISGKTITVAAAALNNSTVTISDGYTLAISNDVTAPKTTEAAWSISGNVATYKNTSISAGYTLDNNQIVYTPSSGGETCTVSGVQSTNGLSISGKTVTVSASALNNGNVTISDGYTLAIANDVTAPKTTAATWSISGNVATYKNTSISAGYTLANNQITYTPNSGGETCTVSGVKSTNGLSINGKTVTVAASALNNGNVTISDGYTLAIANDVAAPKTTEATWSISGNVATYKNTSVSAGYTLANNQITYTPNSGGETCTVSGVRSITGLSISGKTITVAAAALNNSTVTISDGYTLAIANDVTAPKTTEAAWSFNGSTATYKNTETTAGYTLANNQIIYTPNSGGETLVTVKGVESEDGLSINKKTVTVTADALGTNNVTIDGDYKLALGSDVVKPKTTKAWSLNNSTATYNKKTTAGYTLINNTITYSKSSTENLITVTGVKSLKGISLSGNTITISKSSLNQTNVTVNDDDYTLEIGSDVKISDSTDEHFEGLTYKSASNAAGYELSDNEIIYKKAKAATDLFTINGVDDTDDITVSDDKTVTVPKSALIKDDVTIDNNDYTLALGEGVPKPKAIEPKWSYKSGVATYKAGTTEGYSVNAENQIIYNAASDKDTLVTVSGVKSKKGLTASIDKKTVTVTEDALGTGTVTISDGYTLKLGDKVTKSETTKAWSLNKTTATYKQTTTEGYTLAEDKKSITYSSEDSTDDLIKVTGVKSTSGLSVNGKVVTVSNKALNKKTVTISEGYKLKLEDDVTESEATAEAKGWIYKNNVATYKSAPTTEGYTLADDAKSITYSKAQDAKNLASISGISSSKKEDIAVSGKKTFTIPKSVIGSSKNVTLNNNGNGSSFILDKGDYGKAKIKGSANDDVITSKGSKLSIAVDKGDDTVKVAGSNTTVTGGKGNDSLISNKTGGNVFVYANGDGNDVITNFAATDKISITSGKASVAIKDDDVVFTVGKGKITVKDAAKNIVSNGKKINYIDSTGKHATYPSSGVSLKSATINLTRDYDEDSFEVATYGNSIQTINAAAVVHDISITGNKLMNSIVGGASNDTLNGGKGNDSLTGGEGSDVFLYANGDGNDVITDYTEEDKIQITKGTATVKKSDKDVIFTVGDGKITVKGAADKIVTYIDEKGKTNYYPAPTRDSVIINKPTVKLLADYKSKTFDVGNVKDSKNKAIGNEIEMIDASEVSSNLKIVGNAKANVILGGKGNDTINGGKGSDTLQGDDGADVFVYNKGDGKDVIYYDSGDKISLVSGAVSSHSVKGSSDVVLIIDKDSNNKITLTDGADKVITVVDAKGNNRIIGGTKNDNIKGGSKNDSIYGGAGSDTLKGEAGNDKLYGNDGKDSILGGAGNDYLSGDAGDDKLYGGDGNDKILGGSGKDYLSGGAGSDSLWGGAGNDTLYGDDGADTFIYAKGDGKDVIYGFANEDMLKITGTFSTSCNKSKTEIYFKVGSTSNAITLKDFGSTSTFNINGTNYKLGSTKLVKK